MSCAGGFRAAAQVPGRPGGPPGSVRQMRRLVEGEWPVLGIRERSDGTMLRQERLTGGSALRRVANACS
jgi:hypothetical protein